MNLSKLSKKSDCLAAMLRVGIKELAFVRKYASSKTGELATEFVLFDEDTMRAWQQQGDVPAKRRNPKSGGNNTGGPTKEEMDAYLHAWLTRHKPELLRSAVQNAFDAKGWDLIFTPPYCPCVQPIELVWSQAKGYVARMYFLDRSLEQTKDQLRQGFYGDGDDHKKIDCRSLVEHTDKFVLQLAAQDEEFFLPGAESVEGIELRSDAVAFEQPDATNGAIEEDDKINTESDEEEVENA